MSKEYLDELMAVAAHTGLIVEGGRLASKAAGLERAWEERKAAGGKGRLTMWITSGPFDDLLGVRYLRGELSAAEVAAAKPTVLDHREKVRRRFLAVLRGYAPYDGDRDGAWAAAQAIELGCLNEVILRCKASDLPPRRHWDSEPFVMAYGARCGTILSHLDADSSVVAAYGAGVIVRLLEGSITPETLGAMTEDELCPAATAREREEIAQRNAQTLVEKKSTLFACPACGIRSCTYRAVQVRALDEGTTNFCRCDCGCRFVGHS